MDLPIFRGTNPFLMTSSFIRLLAITPFFLVSIYGLVHNLGNPTFNFQVGLVQDRASTLSW